MKNKYEKMTEVLKPLGFTPHSMLPGYYYHEFLGGSFDFTAYSIEEVVAKIYNLGKRQGELEAKENIKNKFDSFIDEFNVNLF